MIHVLYSLAWYLAIPILALRLCWRPGYRHRFSERFGVYPKPSKPSHPPIWLHAVSVGESEAAIPLVNSLLAKGQSVLITTTTPTGAACVERHFGHLIQHIYLPYDLPFAVKGFLNQHQPKLALIMETELWPNLFRECAFRKLPICMINARLSERSFRGYRKLPGLIKPLLSVVTTIAAQTPSDAERFIALGAKSKQVEVTGNLKFDGTLSAADIDLGRSFKKALAGRCVLILGSSHDGEEAILLESLRIWQAHDLKLLLILAPRHPERFVNVADLCTRQGFTLCKRSSRQPISSDTEVFLLDTLGELKAFYQAADIAVVGGSFVPVGGHNLLEPARAKVPVLFGPYMSNFQVIANELSQSAGGIRCQNGKQLQQEVERLYQHANARAELAQNAFNFVKNHQGVLARIVKLPALRQALQHPQA